jgi:hypothetical protein
MSRYYEMSVEITGHRPEKADAIRDAAAGLWEFSDWCDQDDPLKLAASAKGNLCGGETEEEFTERLSVAIWRANGAYCDVTVDATYLESLPYETHCLDQADYARLIGKQQERQDASGPGR